MKTPNLDYHHIFMDEGQSLYSEIFSLDKSKFNNWILENFKYYGTCHSFDEVIPSKKIMDSLIKKGYFHRTNQCHYSSKAVNILNQKIKYITGFIITENPYYPINTHSFNILNKKILDFSRITHEGKSMEDNLKTLPHFYFGIELPHEFVSLYKNETFKEFSMNPLILEWYRTI